MDRSKTEGVDMLTSYLLAIHFCSIEFEKESKVKICWFKHIISNRFIQYNIIFNHTNIRIRMEARAYQVLLLYNIWTKCRRQ